ncbi:MAG: 50S ribosomal protein L1 [Candidatus Handelsmanbacteria bacterium RIFCSPLOWO2_12_FULL_64_10]|uniref:Large ribosomal subunit protein uL1 n=1 Tax=Handelsmanbacteria sp. (strain RIFCSPLOWO2_12_FULL_64_10) TaxID=1817868 RepID=A0A1F6CP26_HANXR|nr:MAG: 50S ribosomal protein L1 [Candidatus Handelsmanbacteria bacterium RIFCSPLOWO2_12_FULL_64_10]
MAHGKLYREMLAKVDRRAQYPLETAIKMLKERPRRKFDETVEVAMNLGVDPRHADQVVRGTVALPHGTGRSLKVLVLTKGELEAEAKEAGADYVGGDDLIKKISEGWIDFDIVVASPDMMGSVGRLGKILGPRGLMPNPKSGTVTREVGKTVREAKAGRIEFRVDKAGNIHAPVGKVSFEEDKLLENARMLIDAVTRAKPSAVKGHYVRTVTLSTTMGPGIRLERAASAN